MIVGFCLRSCFHLFGLVEGYMCQISTWESVLSDFVCFLSLLDFKLSRYTFSSWRKSTQNVVGRGDLMPNPDGTEWQCVMRHPAPSQRRAQCRWYVLRQALRLLLTAPFRYMQ